MRIIPKEPTQTFDDASTACSDDGASLVLLETDSDKDVLQRYLEVLDEGDEGNLYWIGYRYDTSTNLVDVNNQVVTAGVLANEANFRPGEGAADGVCVAIGLDGLFRNVPCTDASLSYICFIDYAGGL